VKAGLITVGYIAKVLLRIGAIMQMGVSELKSGGLTIAKLNRQ
jgi:hypothetical protein